jgi:hypothetical protein
MNEPTLHSFNSIWGDPLAAILEYGGWTVVDLLASPDDARQFRFLWGLLRESRAHSRRITEARETRNAAAEEHWWGEQI